MILQGSQREPSSYLNRSQLSVSKSSLQSRQCLWALARSFQSASSSAFAPVVSRRSCALVSLPVPLLGLLSGYESFSQNLPSDDCRMVSDVSASSCLAQFSRPSAVLASSILILSLKNPFDTPSSTCTSAQLLQTTFGAPDLRGNSKAAPEISTSHSLQFIRVP